MQKGDVVRRRQGSDGSRHVVVTVHSGKQAGWVTIERMEEIDPALVAFVEKQVQRVEEHNAKLIAKQAKAMRWFQELVAQGADAEEAPVEPPAPKLVKVPTVDALVDEVSPERVRVLVSKLEPVYEGGAESDPAHLVVHGLEADHG